MTCVLPIRGLAQGINFQGVARSANGVIIASSNISLRLSIISKNIDAVPEYVETRRAATNAQGIFSVVVGDSIRASAIGTFKNIKWDDGIKFLKVEMDPTAATSYINMGTTQLQYVPYSFYSLGVDGSNVKGIVSVNSGGTGVTSLQELKTALSIDKIDNTSDSLKSVSIETRKILNTKLNIIDTTSITNRINELSKRSIIDTTSLSNRINELSKRINFNTPLPNAIKKGSTAIWDGDKWIIDTNFINNGRRVSFGLGKIVDSSAVFDINSNNGGMLIPRLTEAQRDNIKNPTEGLIIFCKDYFGVNKGGALQIRTGGKWLSIFSSSPTDSTGDCPYIYNVNFTGTVKVDSTITITYDQDYLDYAIPDQPIFKWYTQVTKTVNNQTSLVYDLINGANTNSFKIRPIDNNLKMVVIPTNKIGASCLIGDSATLVFKIFTSSLSINSPISNWQFTIDSLLQNSFPNKVAPDLLTDNIMSRSGMSEVSKYSNQLWTRSYANLNLITNLIESFPKPVAENFKDIYGQLLTLRAINYFFALRAYSSGTLGVPILTVNNGVIDENLTRASVADNLIKIIEDLDLAKNLLNNFTDSRKISKLFANLFRSKVRLYQSSASLVPMSLVINENNDIISQFNLNSKNLYPASDYINLYNDTTNFTNSDDVVLQYSLSINNNIGFLTNSNRNLLGGYEMTPEGIALFGTNDIRKKFISRNTADNKDYFNKYIFKTGARSEQSYAKIMTLSDFYLNVAEANARNGIITAASVNYLNKVITARDTTSTPIVSGSINANDLLNRILLERRKEFFNEGDYYFDYKRFKNGISGLSNYLFYPNKNSISTQYNTLPIPSSVLTSNPQIVQNPGW
jgi:hypothetical protein